MEIVGLEDVTAEQLCRELEAGGRFVVYQYCISVVVMTFKRPSSIYFIRRGEGSFSKGLRYTLCSLALGWWGIPWGPIWTVTTVVQNWRGGRDVTSEVVRVLTHQDQPEWDSDATQYCPRCMQQFIPTATKCSDCGGVLERIPGR